MEQNKEGHGMSGDDGGGASPLDGSLKGPVEDLFGDARDIG